MCDGSGYVKRPLLLIGAAFFVTLWFLTNFGQKRFILVATLVLPIVGFGIIFVRKMSALTLVAVFVTVAAGNVCFFVNQRQRDYFCETLYGKDRAVVGYVYEKEDYNYGSLCVVKLEEVDGVKVDCKAEVYFKSIPPEEIELLRQTEFNADFFSLNSKTALYEKSLRSEGVSVCANCFQSRIAFGDSSKKAVMYYVNMVRQSICNAVTSFIPNDNGRLMIAYVLGDKSGLSTSAKQGFRICGISHLMAVSGLHVYTWSHALFLCLSGFISRRKSAVASALFTLFFMALAGFSPSVVRAGIMMIFVYLGYIFLKVPDSFNSLGAALLLMCAYNPYVVNSTSLQLSFSAAFGLSLMGRRISSFEINFKHFNAYGKALQFVCRTAAVCIVATLFTLPVTVFTFGEVSLINVAANILCVDISMFVMIIGGIGAVLALFKWTKFLGYPLLISAGLLSKLILSVVRFLSRFDFLYVRIDYLQVKVCVVVLVIAALVLFIFKPDFYRNKIIVAFTAVNLILVVLIVVNTVSYVTEVS